MQWQVPCLRFCLLRWCAVLGSLHLDGWTMLSLCSLQYQAGFTNVELEHHARPASCTMSMCAFLFVFEMYSNHLPQASSVYMFKL
jgi:hypothetical protein